MFQAVSENNHKQFFKEVIQAARLWPIWMRLGLQDIRMRYRRSALGFSWIFINLAIFILSVGIIYSYLFRQDLKEFLPFLTVGLVTWNYITASIVEGGNAFVASEGYIKQIGIPIYVYIFRFFVSITITMLVSLPAFLVIALVYSVPFRWGVMWVLPGLLLLAVVSFLLIVIFSLLNARFRDVGHISSVALQVLFFITPVIWPPEMLSKHRLGFVVDFNPCYHLLEIVRHPLLTSASAGTLNYLVVMLLIAMLLLVALILSVRYCKRVVYLL